MNGHWMIYRRLKKKMNDIILWSGCIREEPFVNDVQSITDCIHL